MLDSCGIFQWMKGSSIPNTTPVILTLQHNTRPEFNKNKQYCPDTTKLSTTRGLAYTASNRENIFDVIVAIFKNPLKNATKTKPLFSREGIIDNHYSSSTTIKIQAFISTIVWYRN